MALAIQFGPWQQQGTVSSVAWQVTDLLGDGILAVTTDIEKAGATPNPTAVGQQASGTLSFDAAQYTGMLEATVTATDFAGNTVTAATDVAVANFVAPTPPAWVSFESPTPLSIQFLWQTVALSPTTASWRVVNTKADGTDVVLAEVPVAERQVTVATPTVDLHLVRIYGIDALGNQSDPSPGLSFAFDPVGPAVALAPWVVNAAAATIAWVVLSDQWVTDVAWTLTDDAGQTLSGHGLPMDQAAIPVAGYQGNVHLALTATDSQGRRTSVTASQGVYNVAPPTPQLAIVEVGMHFVRVQVLPGVAGPQPVPVAEAEILGPGGTVFEPSPFIHTFDGLADKQSFSFAARVLTPTGTRSGLSDAVTATTLPDPTDVPVVVPPYTGGPFLPRIKAALTSEVRDYALQFFTDTRLRLPAAPQLVTPPVGWASVLELFTAIGPFLGAILRNETTDDATHEASLLIDQLADPLAKIAVLSERIEFGFIFNPG